jgi:tetratricopeptide (TPR) repeat protein
MKGFRFMPLAALLVAAASLRVQAQGDCKIDYGKPGQLKDADGALKKYELLGTPADKKLNFAKAVTILTKDPTKFQVNPLGRNMAMGRAMADFAALPDMPSTAKRGDVGFFTDSSGTVDLVAAADSAFDAVEAQLPACKAETEDYRKKVYGKLVNDAVNFYNNREIDSAEVFAKRGLIIYPDYKLSYIAYNVLGNVQQSKDDYPGAISSFKKMAALMKGDTAQVEERKNTMLLASQLMTAQGEQKEGEARKAAMQEAVAYLEEYLKEFPGDVKAQSAIARAQLLSGDEAAAKKLFDEMLNNPDKYSDAQMFEAGVGAARADKNDVAATLFKAGLKKNPNSRDGLFNLAAIYDQLGMPDSMPPLLTRLIAIDPENPENFKLWARFYKLKSDQLKPAATKENAPEAAQLAYKNATDSLIANYGRFQDAPVKVSFTLFTHDGPKHVLGGTIDNLSDKDRTYTLKVDFLDASGTVLTSKEVPVEGVAAKGSKSFRVQVDDKPGIVAFKYAPFPKG